MFGLKTLSSGFEVLFLHLDTHNRKKPLLSHRCGFPLPSETLNIFISDLCHKGTSPWGLSSYTMYVQLLFLHLCNENKNKETIYIFIFNMNCVYPAGWEGPDQQVLLCCCRRGLLWCFDKSLPGHVPLHGDAVRLKGSERLWAMVNWVSWSWLTDL